MLDPTERSQTEDVIPKSTLWRESCLAQDVEKKKAEPGTPHLLSLKQDIVAWSQEAEWRLKYIV